MGGKKKGGIKKVKFLSVFSLSILLGSRRNQGLGDPTALVGSVPEQSVHPITSDKRHGTAERGRMEVAATSFETTAVGQL